MQIKCAECGKRRTAAGRGLCHACYNKWHDEQAGIDAAPPNRCKVEGCRGPVHGQGLCNKHLIRLKRTGTTDPNPKFADRAMGPKSAANQHDLYLIWKSFRAKNKPRPTVPEWYDSLEALERDVGVRPGPLYSLRAKNLKLPIGPGNFEWRERTQTVRLPDESDREFNRRQQRDRYQKYPKAYKNGHLRRDFGPDFTFEHYQEMVEAQNNLCAICGEPETATYKGEPTDLSVDHDHEVGKHAVRSLLCRRCNQGIGQLRDDPTLIVKAALYLVGHGKKLTGFTITKEGTAE